VLDCTIQFAPQFCVIACHAESFPACSEAAAAAAAKHQHPMHAEE